MAPRRRRSTDKLESPWFIFSYRAPRSFVDRIDEARWRLRLASRHALVTRALEEFLDRARLDEAAAKSATESQRA